MSDTTNTTTEPTTDPAATEVTDWEAEAKKWKNLADTTDKRAKRLADEAKANAAAAKELETLRQSTMSDTEKAVAQAKNEARTEAMREVGAKLAAAEVRVAAAGRNVDVDALLERLDASSFIDIDGNADTKAITAWVDRVAPAVDDSGRPKPARDLGLGARGGTQSAMTPAEEFGKFITNQLNT